MTHDKKKAEKCPVIGSATDIDLDLNSILNKYEGCDGWCPGCPKVLSCKEVWHSWTPEDLFDEMNRLELEDMIDESLSPDQDFTDSSPAFFDLQCDFEAMSEELPPEIQDFLRELQKLIRRTQIQLKKLHAAK